jgi:large subunit ribosomal protein L25
MDMVEITIERRTGRRKGAARKARRTGAVPAIFYGPKRSTVSLTMNGEEFEKKLAHLEGSHLIRLLHAGQDPDLHDKAVLLREVQFHPVSGAVLHADFFEVDLTERLTVSVALHFVGKAAGVTEGGILQPIQREIEVECLPTEIPQYIEVDVSALGIHEAVHLGEVTLPEGVTAVGDPSQALVTVLPPTVEEAKPTEAAEAVPVEGAAPEGAAAPAAGEAAPAEAKGKKGGGEG